MSRRKKDMFDPHTSLSELISGLEKENGHRIDGEPGAACAAILSQARQAFGEFEHAVVKLHASGQTVAVEIIVGDIERCMRRAVRLAGEHGSTNTGEASHV
jgi:hypothetical protein